MALCVCSDYGGVEVAVWCCFCGEFMGNFPQEQIRATVCSGMDVCCQDCRLNKCSICGKTCIKGTDDYVAFCISDLCSFHHKLKFDVLADDQNRYISKVIGGRSRKK